MKMQTFSPTTIQKTAIKNVRYKIMQMCDSYMLLIKTCSDSEKNAFLESNLLHIRTLIDFFENKSRKKDDIICSDYGFSPHNITGISDKDKTNLNKYLAHLTYSRTISLNHDVSYNWPVLKIMAVLLPRCKEFLIFIRASNFNDVALKLDDAMKTLETVSKALSGTSTL